MPTKNALSDKMLLSLGEKYPLIYKFEYHYALGVRNDQLCRDGGDGIPEGPAGVTELWGGCGSDDH